MPGIADMRRCSLLVVAMLVLSTAAGCALSGRGQVQSGGDETLQVLRVGYFEILPFAPFETARQLGYFEEEGIQIEVVEARGAISGLGALENGDLDILLLGIGADLFNAVARGADLIIIADVARGKSYVSVRKDLWTSGEVTCVRDLAGRRIRVSREGSQSYYALGWFLNQAGLEISDVELVFIKGEAEVLAALSRGEIDATIMAEPFPTIAADTGLTVVIEDGAMRQQVVAATSRRFAENSPDVLRRFLRAYTRGLRVYEAARAGEEPARATVTRIIQDFVGIEADQVDRIEWYQVSPDGVVDIGSIAEMQDFFVTQGLVDNPVSLTDLVDLSFLPSGGH